MDIIVDHPIKHFFSVMLIKLLKLSGLYCVIHHNDPEYEDEHNESLANIGVFWRGWWWESAEEKIAREKEGEEIVHRYFKKWTPYSPKVKVEDIRHEIEDEIVVA